MQPPAALHARCLTPTVAPYSAMPYGRSTADACCWWTLSSKACCRPVRCNTSCWPAWTGSATPATSPTGADQAQPWMSTSPCMARSRRPRPPSWYVRPTWHSASSASICKTSCAGAPGPRRWDCVTTRPKPRPKVARQRLPTTLPPPSAWV
ncbi:hypothetical protein SDC9_162220 [bioreactor metagenome]|uniref:Uncharacterized protein n=1 Tax=bioreactor metagenome TaxID=1076179 RepID=A0A645FKH9_9ZZZZ